MKGPRELQDWLDGTLYPALFRNLPSAFPEFGWRRFSRGWQATRWPADFPESVDHPNPERLQVYGDGPAYIKIHGRGALRFLHLASGDPNPRDERFVEAVRLLAERAGIDASFLERELTPEEQAQAHARENRRAALSVVVEACVERLHSEQGQAARDFLQTRGLTAEDCRNFGLGLYDLATVTEALDRAKIVGEARRAVLFRKMDGYVSFSWGDAFGYPLTLYGRWLGSPPEGQPKTMALPGEGTKGVPFCLERALRAGCREIVAVEGILDAVVLQAKGETRAVAYVAAQFATEQVEALVRNRIERVILCGDPDHGGDKGTDRNVEQLEAAGIPTLVMERLPDGLDPDELVLRDGIEAWRLRVQQATPGRVWQAERALEGLSPDSPEGKRRQALSALRVLYQHEGKDAALDRNGILDLAVRRLGYPRKLLRDLLAPATAAPAASEKKTKGEEKAPPSAPPAAAEGWGSKLLRGNGGALLSNLANLATILSEAPAWKDKLRFNECSHDIELAGAPCLPGPFPRAWRDGDEQLLAIWFQTQWRMNVAPGTVLDAALAVARERSYNPIREHLLALRWDGTPRLDGWLVRYGGAEDSEYVRAVGTAWLRSVAARGLRPGVQVDAALILEGEQGVGKSSIFRILGGSLFVELREVVGDRAVQNMAGKLIGELSELEALGRHEMSAIKGAITCPTDRIRLPWGRRAVDLPRTVVLGGSCNRNDWHRDETGGRRFWPVRLERIDLEALRHDRDQLLAEAVAQVQGGERWHLTDKRMQQAAADQVGERRASDVWEQAVADYLNDNEARVRSSKPARGIPLSDILEYGIELKKEAWGQTEQNRVQRILTALGWTRKNDRLGIDKQTGKERRQWAYHPPALPPPDPPPAGPVPEGGERNQTGTTPNPGQKAAGSTGSTGSTSAATSHGAGCAQNISTPVVSVEGEAKGPDPLSSYSSSGTSGTSGTKREKQEGSGRFQSDNLTGTTGTKAWADAFSEAMAAGYSEEEAAQLADLEAAPPTPQPPGALA